LVFAGLEDYWELLFSLLLILFCAGALDSAKEIEKAKKNNIFWPFEDEKFCLLF